MKITGYVHIKPEHIVYDQKTRTVRLAKEKKGWGWVHVVYPTAEQASAFHLSGGQIYTVQAEVPNNTLFEVRGDIDQNEGRDGTYVAGIFAHYADAFKAAEGLGAQGHRGYIKLRLGIDRIYTSYEDWKNEFNASEAKKAPRHAESTDLLSIVELAPDDPAALGTADPEYALWLKLNEKFGPR